MNASKISPEIFKLFPHEEIRAGQRELIVDIDRAMHEGKILLAHAPTGLGKTASALTVAIHHALKNNKLIFFLTNRHTQHSLAIDTLRKIREKSTTSFTCVDLIGKRWMCSQEVKEIYGSEFREFCKTIVERGECEFYNAVRTKNSISVEAQAFIKELQQGEPLHTEQLIFRGKERGMCSYELALAMAKQARVIICDYNYLFNPFIQQALFTKLELTLEDVIVIVDEGHNLPTRVREMLSNSLTSIMIRNGIQEAKKFRYEGVREWLENLMKILNSLALFDHLRSTPGLGSTPDHRSTPELQTSIPELQTERMIASAERNVSNSPVRNEKQRLISKNTFQDAVEKTVAYDILIEELEEAATEIRKKQRKSYLGGIASFLRAWKGDDQGFIRIIEDRDSKYGPVISLKYDCLDPTLVTKDIFATVASGVVMSGTLHPVFMYKDILGIADPLERVYISPFPPENKLSLVVPDTSTKFTQRGQEMFQQIAEHCTQLSQKIPGNVALFFPSYFLRDRICEFIHSSKKLFWEKNDMSKEEKEQFLAEFHAMKDTGGILLGVSGANFAEGVDFPGDLLQGVVVVGLPLARPDMHTQELIKYYQQKFGRGWEYGYTYPAMSKCIQSAGRCVRSSQDKGVIIYLDQRFAWQQYYSCLPRERLIVTREYDKYLDAFWWQGK